MRTIFYSMRLLLFQQLGLEDGVSLDLLAVQKRVVVGRCAPAELLELALRPLGSLGVPLRLHERRQELRGRGRGRARVVAGQSEGGPVAERAREEEVAERLSRE